jgi:hypothetical protein
VGHAVLQGPDRRAGDRGSPARRRLRPVDGKAWAGRLWFLQMGMLLYSLRNANGYYTQMGAAPLDGLKALLYSEGEYPPRMRDAVVRAFLWEAELSLTCGRKAAPKGDAHYATGSLFRTVCSWVQVPCALNSRYLMYEKGALGPVEGFESSPPEMPPRVAEIYRLLGEGHAEEAYQRADALHGEVARLASGVRPTAGVGR